MMIKFVKIMCILSALFLTTSCSNTAYVDSEYIKSDDGEYSPSSSDTQPIINVIHSDNSTSFNTESGAINDVSLRKIQFDLNEDGIPEDIIIRENSYEIIMYLDESHSKYNSFILPRVESIDIYRRSVDYPGNYTYSFSCVYGENKKILFNMVYTGCENRGFIGGTGYEQDLTPYISYYEHFGSMSQDDFNMLISDPHHFLKECREPGWEYVQTLKLDDMLNRDCTQRYLQNIKITDEVGEIQLFALENDISGRKFKLMNEKYSVYVSDFDSIDIFERTATMEVPTESYHVYEYISRNDRDYLICLNSSVSGSTECVYLGTAEEKYLFFYNFNCNDGFSVENTESLQNEGWQYICSQDISV